MILMSACLVGINCRYDGSSKLETQWLEYLKDQTVIPICPEQLGGLCTPREPVEITGEVPLTVETQNGKSVTDAFLKGAEETLKIAQLVHAKVAILKERSPSCGVCQIYDGSFSHTIIPGQGITARYLAEHGLKLYSEEQLEQFIADTCKGANKCLIEK